MEKAQAHFLPAVLSWVTLLILQKIFRFIVFKEEYINEFIQTVD